MKVGEVVHSPSPDKDDAAVKEAQRQARVFTPAPGSLVRHYKGNDYAVAFPVVDEATLAPGIVYFGTKCGDVGWFRTVDVWNSWVQMEDGSIVRRFAPTALDAVPSADTTALRMLHDRLSSIVSAIDAELMKRDTASPGGPAS